MDPALGSAFPPPPVQLLSSTSTPVNAPIVGHCIYCLRQLIERSDVLIPIGVDLQNELRIVPKADLSPDLLPTFNKLLPFLHKKWKEEKPTVSNSKLTNIYGKKRNQSASNSGGQDDGQQKSSLPKEFPHLPAMCIFCAVQLIELDRIRKELSARIEELRKVIVESKVGGVYSWRGTQFETDLRNNQTLTERSVKATLEFMEGFGVLEETALKSENLESKVGSAFTEEEGGNEMDDDVPDYIKSEVDASGNEEEVFRNENDRDNAAMKVDNSLDIGKEEPIKKFMAGQATKKRKRKRRKEQERVCDLCGDSFPISKLLGHIQGHVGDYAVQCPNTPCPYVCSSTSTLIKKHRHCCRFSSSKETEQKHKYVCESCGFTTHHQMFLRSHLQRHHERAPSKTFSCPLPNCQKVFAVRQSVDFHLSTHNLRPVTQQKCEFCEKYFPIEKISEHLQESHQVQETISCRQCPCVFSTRQGLVEHLFVHRYEGISCDICSNAVKYSRHSELVKHYNEEHQLNYKQYTCELCGSHFFTNETLKTHKLRSCAVAEVTKSKNLKEFPCDLCFLGCVTFKTEESLIRHKIKTHGEDPYTCAFCSKTFTTWVACSRHQKEHAGVTFQKKEFKCNQEGCGKIFNKKANLGIHMVTHGVGGVKCDLCEKRFADSSTLKSHHDAVHLKLRPYVCETCGEGFTSGSSLSRHKLVHTGDRPFSCDRCGQKFRHKEVLKKHVESHEKKGAAFKPLGPMKHIRKRIAH